MTAILHEPALPPFGAIATLADAHRARRLVLATALGIGLLAGIGSEAQAQLVCGDAYQEFCALPGWDDPIDEVCLTVDAGLVSIITTISPCIPNRGPSVP
jgi:hypothetical protein